VITTSSSDSSTMTTLILIILGFLYFTLRPFFSDMIFNKNNQNKLFLLRDRYFDGCDSMELQKNPQKRYE
jgi:hypothetical protein